MILEDLSASVWRAWWDARRVELVLTQIENMHGNKSHLESYARVHPVRESDWQAVAANPEPFLSLHVADSNWLDAALPILISGAMKCKAAGEALCHWDLRSDNICTTKTKAVFVDWNLACLSNPKLNLSFWLPSLEFEGGPKPETILPEATEVAAWVSGFLPHSPDCLKFLTRHAFAVFSGSNCKWRCRG